MKREKNQFRLGDHLGKIYSGHRVMGYDSERSEKDGEPCLFCICDYCGRLESIPLEMLITGDPPECPCVERRREPERVKYGSIYVTYTQDFTDIGKGYLYLTYSIPEWAQIFGIDPELLNRYLGRDRGKMSVNQALEFCNSIPHGGNGFRPIIIPDDMMDKNAVDRLGESIRDFPFQVHPHRYLLASELIERARQREEELARCHGKKIPKRKKSRKDEISNDPLYRKWEHLKARCYDPDDALYQSNGARGVAMSNAWRKSFEAFRDWCYENGYRKDGSMVLTRIDPMGDYRPSNCTWISE